MPRKGTRDLAKERYWRGLIQDWSSSGKSGAEFCRLHGIKYYQLKEWRQVIQKRDAESKPSQQSSVTGERSRKTRKGKPIFTHFVQAKITDSHSAKPIHPNQSPIELTLPCGMVMRVASACSPDFLASVVTALENR